ncbi:hypothetical protein DFH08DRAFT_674096, partial [Mycena albidolilacea]
RNAHNHPMRPKIKPSAEDCRKLGAAVQAAGLTGLTTRKLLNGESPSTTLVYGGDRVADQSPAFTDTRKVRDFISAAKKKEHPDGMEFDGQMDEWEVAAFMDRFGRRLTFASLYCDTKSQEAFEQLFIELFDVIKRITGETFKLAPFFPDAKCHIIMLDGEVAQAVGLGNHIDELPIDISKPVIEKLKSIMRLTTQEEIDEWHQFAAAQTHPDITNWYRQKLANPWILPSVNKFLSNITDENWDITPNHSNLVETAHAGRNAETSTGVALLTGILQARERDNIIAGELTQFEQNGILRQRFNGSAEREKLSAKRRISRMRKTTTRNEQITGYEALRSERDTGVADHKASIEHQKTLEQEIKLLQEDLKLDKRRTDLREKINILRADIEEEKAGRRAWVVRQTEIDTELASLRSGPLAGTRINGRRP